MSPIRNGGFTYVEVLVASMIVVGALLPAINALSGALSSTQAHTSLANDHFHVSSRMQNILAQPLAALDAEALAVADAAVPTSYSDAPGTPRRRLVYLSRYDGDDADGDGDPFTGGDDGLLWVKVQIEKNLASLESLTGD